MVNFEIMLASPPDREQLVVMVMVDKEQLCEINRENGMKTIELYRRQDGQPWSLPLGECLAALNQACERLEEALGTAPNA